MGSVFPIEIYAHIATFCTPWDARALFSSFRAARHAKQKHLEKAIECYSNAMRCMSELVKKFKQCQVCFFDSGLDFYNAGRTFSVMSIEVVPIYWIVYAFTCKQFDNHRKIQSCKMLLHRDLLVQLINRTALVSLQSVKNQSYFLCKQVIKDNPFQFCYCKNKTPKLRRIAIKGLSHNILLCDNPTDDELQLAIDASVALNDFSWFSKLNIQPEWASNAIMTYDIHNVRYIKILTYELCMLRLSVFNSPHAAFQSYIWSFMTQELRDIIEYDICEKFASMKRIKI